MRAKPTERDVVDAADVGDADLELLRLAGGHEVLRALDRAGLADHQDLRVGRRAGERHELLVLHRRLAAQDGEQVRSA